MLPSEFHLESRPCPKCGATMLFDDGEPWDGATWGCTGCGHSENAEAQIEPDAAKMCVWCETLAPDPCKSHYDTLTCEHRVIVPTAEEWEEAKIERLREHLRLAIDHIAILNGALDDLASLGATIAICGAKYDDAAARKALES